MGRCRCFRGEARKLTNAVQAKDLIDTGIILALLDADD